LKHFDHVKAWREVFDSLDEEGQKKVLRDMWGTDNRAVIQAHLQQHLDMIEKERLENDPD